MKYLRVLLVDEDPAFLAESARALTEAKYSVEAVSDFDRAAHLLKRSKGRAAVLSELNVKGKCGLDFLKDTLKQFPHVPFTFLAHSPPLEAVIEALKRGAYDFLRKPVDPGILCHSVARSVEKLNLSLESEKQEAEIRDLLKKSRNELKETRAIGAFKGFMISTAAHDFRSVLTVLDGYHQIIKDKCIGCTQPMPAHLLEQARRSISRLRTMASTLLDYEAAERGELKVVPRSFELDALLRECATFYRPYAEQKKVDLALEHDIPRLKVTADPARVMEVLDNILYNAVKFTPTDGEIRIGAERDDGQNAIVWVRDTGIGIPKPMVSRIFDEKEVVTKKDSSARLGLGLNICRRLIEIQKGRIWLESSPGKGTKVLFSLPGQ